MSLVGFIDNITVLLQGVNYVFINVRQHFQLGENFPNEGNQWNGADSISWLMWYTFMCFQKKIEFLAHKKPYKTSRRPPTFA